MQRFKEFLKESIVDFPRQTFAMDVWDKADSEDPVLKKSIKDIYEKKLAELAKIATIKGVTLIGSVTTKQYGNDADLDTNILVDAKGAWTDTSGPYFDAWNWGNKNSGRLVPGTKHPMNFAVLNNKKLYETAIKFADAAYNIETDGWVKKAKTKELDVGLYADAFDSEVKKFDLAKGELDRDIIDLAQLQSYGPDDLKDLSARVNNKIKELEADSKTIIALFQNEKDARRESFKTDLTPSEIAKYGKHNRLPKNVVFKLIEKYHYDRLVDTLKYILGDDKKLSPDEAKRLQKLVVTESYSGGLKKGDRVRVRDDYPFGKDLRGQTGTIALHPGGYGITVMLDKDKSNYSFNDGDLQKI